MQKELEVLFITGLSGAGKTNAGSVAEDLGWLLIDNLPVTMIPVLIDLFENSDEGENSVPPAENKKSNSSCNSSAESTDESEAVKRNTENSLAKPVANLKKIAFGVDVRSRAFGGSLVNLTKELKAKNIKYRILFLDASDDVLIRRFESVRRPHVLQGTGTVSSALKKEREALAEVRSISDIIIDTSDLTIHELAVLVRKMLSEQDFIHPSVHVFSFGFKYGIPLDADHVVDARFLPNPFWVPELKNLSGLDAPVRDYVFSQVGANEFLDKYTEALKVVLEHYGEENKFHANIAIGCTGGRHRSVALAEEIGKRIRNMGEYIVTVGHRDIDRV